MSGYIYGVICASLAIGVAEILVPENAKSRPYLKLLFGLALMLVIVKPLGGLISSLPELSNELFESELDADEYAEIADEQLSEAYGKGIAANLEESFGLSDFEVGVLVGEDRRPARVTVTLMGKEIFRNPYKIEEHVSRAFGRPCVVVVG